MGDKNNKELYMDPSNVSLERIVKQKSSGNSNLKNRIKIYKVWKDIKLPRKKREHHAYPVNKPEILH